MTERYEPWIDYDSIWDITKGVRGRGAAKLRTSPDPLTARILQMRGKRVPKRAASITENERRQADLGKYSPEARRLQRAGPEHGPPSPALTQHRADLAALYARLGVQVS